MTRSGAMWQGCKGERSLRTVSLHAATFYAPPAACIEKQNRLGAADPT